MKSETKPDLKQLASIGILILMLIIRFGDSRLATFLFSTDDIKIYYFSSVLIILLMCIALGLERDNPTSLHVDSLFILLFVISSGLTLVSVPFLYSIVPALGTIFIFSLFLRWGFNFQQSPTPWIKTLIVVALPPLVTLVPFIFKMSFLNSSAPETNDLIYYFSNTSLIGVVYEEFLFRGLLWKYLKKLRFSERTVFIVTSLLFWLAHYEYLLDSSLVVFWIYIPIISILLGFVVYRTKSIGFSSISHFLTNVAVKI